MTFPTGLARNFVKHFCLLALFAFSHVFGSENPIVNIDTGKIQGHMMLTEKGRDFFAFQGVPYAKPPVGDLRLKRPQPTDPWSDVRNATQEGNSCPQINFLTGNLEGNEDCLVLNIYTPKISSDELLPVMVYFHGGGFITGNGGTIIYSPTLLLDNDVILVTMNYRLGVLGFLSTRDDESWGNYGMFDQVEALKWVQRNIIKFGGNPNRVTIFGESAGGAAVSLHLISQHSKGLFHAAIMQSGTAMCEWAIQKEPRKWAKILANKLGCTAQSTQALVSCIKEKPVDDIIIAHASLRHNVLFPLLFTPTVEERPGGFLQKCPRHLYETKQFHKVPTIIGLTEEEGGVIYALFATMLNFSSPSIIEEDLPIILPAITDANWNVYPILSEIKKEYFSKISLSDPVAVRRNVISLFSDFMFRVGSQIAVDAIGYSGTPIYTYTFKHVGKASFASLFGVDTSDIGASHADDLLYLFGNSLYNKLGAEDKRVAKIMVSLWTNFAATSNPTPNMEMNFKWEQVDMHKPSYLEINSRPNMVDGVFSTRLKFWDQFSKVKGVYEGILKDEL